MEPEESFYPRPKRRRALGLVVLILFVVCNLLVGVIGGVAGFVFLANTRSPWVEQLRTRLGVDDTTGVAVPIRQNVRVEESSVIIDAVKKVSPAVVSISTSQKVQDFFGNVSDKEVSGGTGFIITSDGLIVTNNHVIENPGTYKVVLNDGKVYDATIQATDAVNDFAVLKIDGKDLPTVELGSSDALQVGQYVLAVGNALGEFKNSVTLGVISAKERSISASGGSQTENLDNLLQTDAAINPGNSGGPLVNVAGQVIGMNTAIASTTGGNIGVGFAIPIDSVKNAIDSVRKTGKIERPYLGIRYSAITPTMKQLNNLPVDHGALVGRGNTAGELAVIPGSPADKAGIVENDIILEINGERIDETTSLAQRLRKYKSGDTVTLKVYRKGAEIEVKVTLDKQSS